MLNGYCRHPQFAAQGGLPGFFVDFIHVTVRSFVSLHCRFLLDEERSHRHQVDVQRRSLSLRLSSALIGAR